MLFKVTPALITNCSLIDNCLFVVIEGGDPRRDLPPTCC